MHLITLLGSVCKVTAILACYSRNESSLAVDINSAQCQREELEIAESSGSTPRALKTKHMILKRIRRSSKKEKIFQIIAQLIHGIIKGGYLRIVDLALATQAKSNPLPELITWNLLRKLLVKLRVFWAWSNQTHGSNQNAPKMWQLVQPHNPEQGPTLIVQGSNLDDNSAS